MHCSIIAAFVATVISSTSASAIPNPFLGIRQADGGFAGVATFNDYVDQVEHRNQKTVCGDYHDDGNIFAAAAGDLSPHISNGRCSYTSQESSQDRSLCTADGGQQPDFNNYYGPACPSTACGSCYKITNNDTGKSVTVKIVDACPALSAYNYCKSNTEPAGKCSGDKDALDISVKAYPILANASPDTGKTGSTQNLNNLSILPLASCSG